MGHATTWSEDEDIILADSWIAISCDPIKSNQQGGETFWERIFALFSSKLMKKHGEHAASFRTVTAVQNRWSLMNHDFNKFAGCLAHVKALQKSQVLREKQRPVQCLLLVQGDEERGGLNYMFYF